MSIIVVFEQPDTPTQREAAEALRIAREQGPRDTKEGRRRYIRLGHCADLIEGASPERWSVMMHAEAPGKTRERNTVEGTRLAGPGVVELLAGLRSEDPAVRFLDAAGWAWSWHPDDPNACDAALVGGGLLVEQSEAALVRLLARSCGWGGEGRPVLRLRDRVWEIRALDRGGWDRNRVRPYSAVFPGVDDGLSYHEALAELVIRAARTAVEVSR